MKNSGAVAAWWCRPQPRRCGKMAAMLVHGEPPTAWGVVRCARVVWSAQTNAVGRVTVAGVVETEAPRVRGGGGGSSMSQKPQTRW